MVASSQFRIISFQDTQKATKGETKDIPDQPKLLVPASRKKSYVIQVK